MRDWTEDLMVTIRTELLNGIIQQEQVRAFIHPRLDVAPIPKPLEEFLAAPEA